MEGLIYIDICQARLSELMMSTPFFSLVRVGNDLLFEREGGRREITLVLLSFEGGGKHGINVKTESEDGARGQVCLDL